MKYVPPYEDALRHIGRTFDAIEDLERCFYRIEDRLQRQEIARLTQSIADMVQGIGQEMRGLSQRASDD